MKGAYEVSVLMPIYNGEKFLAEAIESILNQTFTDFEFIIVNDGSTDRTLAILQSYSDSRIKVIDQKNGGVSNALNTGLKHASGKYIARMDGDDIAHPTRLEKQYDFFIKNPTYKIIGSDANYITEEKEFFYRYQSPAYTDEEIRKIVADYCVFLHPSVMFVKEDILKLGGYHEDAWGFEDHFLWAKFIKEGEGKVFNLDETLIDYRFNKNSVTVDYNDYDPEYLIVKNNVLRTGNITESDAKILRASVKKLDAKLRAVSYHRLLAKKFLWDNYNLKKARENLKMANRIAPFQKKTMLLYLISLLPKEVILFIYTKFKK